jgi:hypothetical protein
MSLFSQPLLAGEFSTQIKAIKFEKNANWYQLRADIDYHLSPIATKAIQSSIALTWCLKIKLEQTSPLWDNTLIKHKYCYKIRYHALLDSYSVHPPNNQKSKYFTSLAIALDSMSQIRNLKLIEISALDKNALYTVATKLQFEREILPLPLRPVAYLNSDWDLSSSWQLWKLEP